MALVAFHIHVDNLITDADNIVTLGLFLIPQKYFIATIAVYIIYIYFFFPGPASASMISATKPHLFSRTSWICSPRALDNPELDSLDEHD